MKNIISGYAILFAFVCNILICVQVAGASGQTAAAKEYKADIVSEIENSNFNSNVIAACISQAEAAGYHLEVKNCTYDEYLDIQTAEIVLEYSYSMPIFGIKEKRTTRGIAR